MTTINYQDRRIRLGKHMAAALKFALHYPEQWHDIGHDRAMRDAVKRLKAAGLIEVRDYSNQYRVKP
jgi:ribosomal protein L19E